MAETPEIPAVPAGTAPAEAENPSPDPAQVSPDGAAEAADRIDAADPIDHDAISWAASVSPAVVGSYATPAPAASAEPPLAPVVEESAAEAPSEAASQEAAPAMFVAGYGVPEQTATPTSVPGSEPAAESPASTAFVPASYQQPVAEQPAESSATVSPAPATIQAAPQESEPPGIAASLAVPPLPDGEAGEGGEWDLLVGKVNAWFDGTDFRSRWESLGGPLRAAGLLLAGVVVLRLYSALIDTLGDLPLVPRLLQLVGLISVVQFCLTRLVRSSERERIVAQWKDRWIDFRGRN